MIFETGSFSGNDTARTITLNEIATVPDFIGIKRVGVRHYHYRTVDMSDSQRLIHSGTYADAITSLDAGSFDMGGSIEVNASGFTYVYIAIYDDGNGDFEVGSFTGNVSSTQTIATGLSNLEQVWLFEDASAENYWHSLSLGGTTDASFPFGSGTVVTGMITDITTTPGSFIAGSGMNDNGTVYNYAVFAPVAGLIDSLSYSGNSTDDRNLDVDSSDSGNTIEFVHLQNATTSRNAFWRAEENGRGITTDFALVWNSGEGTGNRIQDFPSAEIVQLSDHLDVNASANTYHMFWLLSNPTAVGGVTTLRRRNPLQTHLRM